MAASASSESADPYSTGIQRPVRNIFLRLCDWPKTFSDFAFTEPVFWAFRRFNSSACRSGEGPRALVVRLARQTQYPHAGVVVVHHAALRRLTDQFLQYGRIGKRVL
jgi:hypothetical protein